MTQLFFFTPVGVFAKLFQMPEWKSGHCKNEFAAFSLEDVMLLLLFYVNVVDGHCPKRRIWTSPPWDENLVQRHHKKV